MSETMVRETAAPWYLRQVEFDGYVAVLVDTDLKTCWELPSAAPVGARFSVAGVRGRLERCPHCGNRHAVWAVEDRPYSGDSLEDAEAAYAILERQLLDGTLGDAMEKHE